MTTICAIEIDHVAANLVCDQLGKAAMQTEYNRQGQNWYMLTPDRDAEVEGTDNLGLSFSPDNPTQIRSEMTPAATWSGLDHDLHRATFPMGCEVTAAPGGPQKQSLGQPSQEMQDDVKRGQKLSLSACCSVVFTRGLGVFLMLLSLCTLAPAETQDALDQSDRFVGEAQIALQAPQPVHLDIFRSGDAVEGTVSMHIAAFEFSGTQGETSITGRFEGAGAEGEMTLVIEEDRLTGTFTLGDATGTITAHRTTLDAQTFLMKPDQKLDLTEAQWTADLDRLAEILMQEHGSPFEHISPEVLDSEIERLRAVIPSLDGIAVALEFQKLAALIGDGHTEVELPSDRPQMPIELFWFEDGIRVVEASISNRDLLGSRLVAINAVPIEDIITRLHAFIPKGETAWFIRERLPSLVVRSDILGIVDIGPGPTFTVAMELASGGDREVELTAAVPESFDLTSLGGGALWQQNEADGLWWRTLSDGSVYVNWRNYDNLYERGAELLKELDAHHPRRLVIDLRDNSGGDFNVGRAFVEQIQRRSYLNRAGSLHVLIGRKTFSAAMVNAIDFKTLTRARLTGEPAGAAPNNWQEVRRFYLPNSGLVVGVSTQFYEFLPGQDELRPDVHIRPELADWGAFLDGSVRHILEQP